MRTFLFWVAVAVLLYPQNVAAVQASPLLFGADARSNAPYGFVDPGDLHRLEGFEIDIIDAVASRMGRSTRLIQNDWDALIPGLNRRLYDVVINGLEITTEHKAAVDFSIPYYTTFEQLVVRAHDYRFHNLSDLRGRKVGTLKTSLAERILEHQRTNIVIVYDEEINAYSDLANDRLDAVLLDYPIALYYAGPDRRLRMLGGPIDRVQYGIAVRKGDSDLLQQVNLALRDVIRSGELRRILERWNLWTPTMASAVHDFSPRTVEPVEYRRFISETKPLNRWPAILLRYTSFLPLLAKAAAVTLEVSVLGMALAIVLGLVLAIARQYGTWFLSTAVVGYIEIIRGTPLLIQILFVFYGLPGIGLKLNPLLAGILALGLNYAAYEAENYRAGLISIATGQMEAALALNMTDMQAARHVIVPQAFRVVVPVMTNDFISLLKDSSLVSMITITELTRMYQQLSTTYYDFFGTGILVGAIYLLIGLPFVRLARWTEQRLKV